MDKHDERAREILDKLTSEEKFVLKWLSEADSSVYGECRGHAVNVLVNMGLAKTSEIPPSDYSRVSLTEAGRAAVSAAREQTRTDKYFEQAQEIVEKVKAWLYGNALPAPTSEIATILRQSASEAAENERDDRSFRRSAGTKGQRIDDRKHGDDRRVCKTRSSSIKAQHQNERKGRH